MKTFYLNEELIRNLSDVLFIPTSEAIASTVGNRSTWYRIMQRPSIITVQQLLAIANGLHVPVRRFFYADKTKVIGRRDEYVAEPYLPCSYDARSLQSLVASRPGVTWNQASTATGVTRDNLRNSLLAVRRLPVTRFLTSCEALGIDPFEVLIDPNPEPKARTRRGGTTDGEAAVRAEIATLRSEVSDLSSAVADLTAKYCTLLAEHEKLARRVQVNIDTINNSGYIGIAAESGED